LIKKVKTMKEKKSKEIVQDKQYEVFPYHYLLDINEHSIDIVNRYDFGFDHYFLITLAKLLIKRIDIKSILDVGCGDGKLIYEICLNNQLVEGFDRIIGLDKNEKAIQFAKVINADNKADFKTDDIFEFDIKNFELLILMEVIEHISPNNLPEFINEISSHMQKDAYILICVPSTNIPVHPKHYNHFDIESLKALIPERFNIRNVFYISSNCLYVKVLKQIYMFLDYFNIQKLKERIFSYYRRKYMLTSSNKCLHIMILCQKT